MAIPNTLFGRSLPDIKFALDVMETFYGPDWTQNSALARMQVTTQAINNVAGLLKTIEVINAVTE